MGFLDRAQHVQNNESNTNEKKQSPTLQAEKIESKPASDTSLKSKTQSTGTQEAQTNISQTKTQAEILEEQRDPRSEAVKEKLESITPGTNVHTLVDEACKFLEDNNKKATIAQIATHLNIPVKSVENMMRVLAQQDIVEIEYALIFVKSPVVKLINTTSKILVQQSLEENKKLLESYTVISDYVVANVNIWNIAQETTPIYQILPHQTQYGTDAIIVAIIDELAKSVNATELETSDLRKYGLQKADFFEKAKTLILKYIPNLDEEFLYLLSGIVVHRTLGLGEVDIIMSDDWLEEVAMNAKNQPISVFHKKYGWLKSTVMFSNDDEVYNLALHIGRRVGKQITSLAPIMDAHMQTGDRVAATLFPISTEGDTLTIRRFSRNPWTITHMINEKNHTLSKEIMAFLWLAMQYELNLLVVGGTASGKTSVLNSLSSLSPPKNRIISIEDTREISLPDALHWNWVPLVSKSANSEGEGEVSMLDLMVASLRMRPDRIVVGEIRRKEQAEALFEAMHTGHAVSATMHADTAEQVKHRLTQPPIDIPENEIEALQLILVQYRDRRRGIRRTLEVAEILPGSSDSKVNLNYLYRWRPRNDTFIRDESSIRVVEDLNLHTGMTERDIANDLAQKEEILQWMLDHDIYDIDKVGQIMRIYYKYPDLLIDVVKDNNKFEELMRLDNERNIE